jgi:hypothetical protein
MNSGTGVGNEEGEVTLDDVLRRYDTILELLQPIQPRKVVGDMLIVGGGDLHTDVGGSVDALAAVAGAKRRESRVPTANGILDEHSAPTGDWNGSGSAGIAVLNSVCLDSALGAMKGDGGARGVGVGGILAAGGGDTSRVADWLEQGGGQFTSAPRSSMNRHPHGRGWTCHESG